MVAYSPFAQRDQLKLEQAQQQVVSEIAEMHQVGESAIALRFLIDRGTWVIPKALRIEHVEENAKALSFELTDAQIRKLDEVFAKGKPGPLPML